MTYSSLSKRFPKHSYFCGWYYRCQSDKQTLAIIPTVHKTKDSVFCTIQVITDTHAFHVQFPYDDFWGDDDQIRISNNRFGKSGFLMLTICKRRRFLIVFDNCFLNNIFSIAFVF